MNRRRLLALSAVALFFLALHLYLGSRQRTGTAASWRHSWTLPLGAAAPTHAAAPIHTAAPTSAAAAPTHAAAAPTHAAAPAHVVADGHILNAGNITQYLDAILDTSSTLFHRLKCPAINTTRYHDLTVARSASKLDYFFALNLRENLDLLPHLLGNIIEAIKYLGPERCALSIVEGNSPDGTADVLAALKAPLDGLGISYYFGTSDLDPKQGQRIIRLAALRNQALEPLYNPPSTKIPPTSDTTVVFINDVAICVDDILELVHQRRHLGADMTCAMDWMINKVGQQFYDIWISRTLAGDSFIWVPNNNGSWEFIQNLFWNDKKTKARFDEKLPFQVFACWNGAVAFTAQPFLSEGLRFRANKEGECYQGEPNTLCKDLWFTGHRKIAVVPSVNLEYSVDRGEIIKKNLGFASDAVKNVQPDRERIEWQHEPPEKVLCMPTWQTQVWLPWNESLTH
ncbi:hypothetical protein E4U53_001406 [Claviceps sorghi]|nr:hypothetical protein E4U53_001406 [Claviceps sorghi]